MGEEFGMLQHRMLFSMLTLGVFCLVSVAYSVFVWLAPVTDDVARESRVRSTMLAGVTILSGAIIVLALNQVTQSLELLSAGHVAPSSGLALIGRIYPALPAPAWWGIVGGVGIISLIPLFVRDDLRRTRLNKGVAGLTFACAMGLILMVTAIFGIYRALAALGNS
jgi:hypothetical protein